MFRTGEAFLYTECGHCGTMQIVDVPSQLSRYHDADHYCSFNLDGVANSRYLQWKPIKHLIRLNARTYNRFGIGRGFPWARAVNIERHQRILDIGCGARRLLQNLDLLGYRNLVGADPFLQADSILPSGTLLIKRTHDAIEVLMTGS